MYSPVHATVGILLSRYAPNPAVAVLFGVASHYLLDAVPHGDMLVGRWLRGGNTLQRMASIEVIDLWVAVVMVAWLASHVHQQSIAILISGAIGGILPDLLWGSRFVLERLRWRIPLISPFLVLHDRWHTFVHAKAQYDLPFWAGLTYQIAFLLLIGIRA